MDLNELRHGTELLKRGFAAMQKGGVIMDVTTPAQAVLAEGATNSISIRPNSQYHSCAVPAISARRSGA